MQDENILNHSGTAVIFRCGSEYMAIDMMSIREIQNVHEFTPIPRLPDYISGVINMMGEVVPVIDLAKKLKLAEEEYTSRSCLIVVESEGDVAAVRVHEVLTSEDFNESNFIDLPDGSSIVTGYINTVKGRVSLINAAEIIN